MRRVRFIFLVLSLLLTLFYVQALDVPAVSSSTIHQGDLILTGDNVTTIEGRFDINGSIYVEDNATLILKNAAINFTQSENFQYHFRLQENSSAQIFNSTITASNLYFNFLMIGTSTTVIENTILGPKAMMQTRYNATLLISNSSCYKLQVSKSSVLYANELTVEYLQTQSVTEIHDSEIESLETYSKSVNCSISNFHQGLIDYWNFISNCSVSIRSGGYAPNITLVNTDIYYWRPHFIGDSNVSISNSTFRYISIDDFSTCYLDDTYFVSMIVSNSTCWITDSFFGSFTLWGNSTCWLMNSTGSPHFHDGGLVYVSWYLDVLVEDSVGQAVPSASVTVSYPNSTVVDSKLTDDSGRARFALMEKMMNLTSEYPVGNYGVEATYESYSDSETVNMTETKQIILTLEDFIIPELSSLALLSTFIIATIAVILVNRRKQQH
jgi:hypothetical protein